MQCKYDEKYVNLKRKSKDFRQVRLFLVDTLYLF